MPEETERAVVRTYVPAYQKETWEAAAEDLEMSLSEFVRTMAQAGRREFDVPAESEPDRTPETDATPGVEGLESRIIDALESGPLDWDELIDRLTEDIEQRVDEQLERLQSAGRVRYSGRAGGYTLTDE